MHFLEVPTVRWLPTIICLIDRDGLLQLPKLLKASARIFIQAPLLEKREHRANSRKRCSRQKDH